MEEQENFDRVGERGIGDIRRGGWSERKERKSKGILEV